MIIALEGLACAGKSSIAKQLEESYFTIPEFIVDTGADVTTTTCQVNDIAKSQLAILEQARGDVIMDRSFLSTLAYTYAESDNKYQETAEWYEGALKSGLVVEPDLIVFSAVSAEVSLRRAKQIKRFDERFAWFTAPERALAMYDRLLGEPERSSRIVTIDSEQTGISESSDLIRLKINKIGTIG